LKIYPAFFALVAFTCVAQLRSHTFIPHQALAEIFFVQNYFHGQWLHTWSLAVEEHFYLAAALAVAILVHQDGANDHRDTGLRPVQATLENQGVVSSPRSTHGPEARVTLEWSNNPFRCVPLAALVIGIACLALRIITSILHPDFDFYIHIFPTHLRADSLMFGVLLCYLDQFHHLQCRSILSRFKIPLAILSAALIAPAFVLEPENLFMRTAGLTALYLGFGGLLMLALQSQTAGDSRAIRTIGRVGFFSYSIYLWHIVWRHVALGLALPHFWELCLVYVLGSIVLGMLMSRLIEIPVLYLRDRFFPSDVSPITSDASPGSTQKSSTRSSGTPAQTG
jgi:peptidoglycan/LPS O-acetylase OafA/YrhL